MCVLSLYHLQLTNHNKLFGYKSQLCSTNSFLSTNLMPRDGGWWLFYNMMFHLTNSHPWTAWAHSFKHVFIPKVPKRSSQNSLMISRALKRKWPHVMGSCFQFWTEYRKTWNLRGARDPIWIKFQSFRNLLGNSGDMLYLFSPFINL